jgi:hypothetical protein
MMKKKIKSPDKIGIDMIVGGIIITEIKITKNPNILILNLGLEGNTFILHFSQKCISSKF